MKHEIANSLCIPLPELLQDRLHCLCKHLPPVYTIMDRHELVPMPFEGGPLVNLLLTQACQLSAAVHDLETVELFRSRPTVLLQTPNRSGVQEDACDMAASMSLCLWIFR